MATIGASWFETALARLLTMRSDISIDHLSHSLAARGRVGIAAEIPRP
jgi:hypothetical protein